MRYVCKDSVTVTKTIVNDLAKFEMEDLKMTVIRALWRHRPRETLLL